MRNNIAKINIMMLTVVEALYLHKTTILAAEKLGIAQPSISWYLKQLRALTGDELFIRTAKTLEPTDFCTGYYKQAKEILDALDNFATYGQTTFDPKSEPATFSVVIPFFKARMLLESLSVNLTKVYPLIWTNLLYLKEEESLTHLDSGMLDIYIGLISEKLPKHFRSEKLLDSEFIVLCSDKSAFFKHGKISKKDFIETPHIKLSAGFEPSILDVKLKQCGLLPKNLISVPDIGSEIILLRETDYLLIIDKNDAEIIIAGNNFKILKTDFALPQLPLYAVWPSRKNTAPAHEWFRKYMKEQCQAYKLGKKPDVSRFSA